MIKNLLLLLFLIQQIATAQDTYFSTKETRYPIRYSRTKILVKFRDAREASQIRLGEISVKAKSIEPIHSIPDMAYVVFDAG
ncbi:hypothetical protein [Dyadobacter sp. CY323]|uniref:hypothetical protein n=1 Tax=Dyadobacter sp. CY323 TaxID=2907302 RepID=UPI001F3F2D2E|nr:hypothetical protein [Dyadobacter sp. CY323]MCE6988288.1 hypothetical protein [Dyadobacter sp. CY323]